MNGINLTRSISKAAYDMIKKNGLLTKRKWQVYDYVFNFGPVTQRETWNALKGIDGSIIAGSINTRFSELERVGVMQIVGEKMDPLTKHIVSVWDVTDGLPKKEYKIKLKEVWVCPKMFLEWENNLNQIFNCSPTKKEGWVKFKEVKKL